MTKKRNLLALLMIGVLGIMCLTGCSNENSDNNKSQSSNTMNNETSEDSEVSSKTLEKILQKGQIDIATTGTYRPYTYVDENNELQGFEIDMGKAIAEKLGVEANFITGDLDGLIPSLTAGKWDLVMTGVFKEPSRLDVVDISTTYASDGFIAVTLADSNCCEDITKLDGLVVGCINSSSAQTIIENDIGGYKELKGYPGNTEAYADLKAGRIDVYVTNYVPSADFIANDTQEPLLKQVGEVYGLTEIGAAMAKDDTEFKDTINKAIEECINDGTVDEIGIKYTGGVLARSVN